jgi:hypothetical protein
MYFFEPDYQRWLFIDLAARYGRERILSFFGLTRDRLMRDAARLPAAERLLAASLAKAKVELNPDFVLFGKPPERVHFWNLLHEESEHCPPIDAIIETKFATGKWRDRRGDFVKDTAKLAVWGEYVQHKLREQCPPYLALWLFDAFGYAAGAERERRSGFHSWFAEPLRHTEEVRVVWFAQDGTRRVLLPGRTV